MHGDCLNLEDSIRVSTVLDQNHVDICEILVPVGPEGLQTGSYFECGELLLDVFHLVFYECRGLIFFRIQFFKLKK